MPRRWRPVHTSNADDHRTNLRQAATRARRVGAADLCSIGANWPPILRDMNKPTRRTPSSNWIGTQRLADYTRRASTLRAVAVVVAGAALAGGGGSPIWAWVLVVLPAIGVYLAWYGAVSLLRDRLPVDPFAAWATRIGDETEGKLAVNVSGVAEALGGVTLLALGPWAMSGKPEHWRLVALAAAAAFATSWLCAVFLDVAWYNPDETFPHWLESLRDLASLGGALIIAGIALPAPWTPNARWIVIAICVAVAAVQMRIRETDRLMRLATERGHTTELDGRTFVTATLHGTLGNPMTRLRQLAEQRRREDRDLFDAVRQVESVYRETLALDWSRGITVKWPGVLLASLRAVEGFFGTRITFDPPPAISQDDRWLARLVLDDLARNAAQAGATRVAMRMILDSDEWLVDADDDAVPFRDGHWMQPGGGLERISQLLRSRDGSLSVRHYDVPSGTGVPTKTVSVRWRAQSPDAAGGGSR